MQQVTGVEKDLLADLLTIILFRTAVRQKIPIN